jgi:hypothetical protein
MEVVAERMFKNLTENRECKTQGQSQGRQPTEREIRMEDVTTQVKPAEDEGVEG